jgi:hypothetical protein
VIGSHAQSSRVGASNVNSSDFDRDFTTEAEGGHSLPPYPITFLYRYTDPRRESILNAFRDERIFTQESHDADSQLFDGDMALFGIFSDFSTDTSTDICALTSKPSVKPQTTPHLQSRIKDLCSQLFTFSQTHRRVGFDRDSIFSVDAAKAVFTEENFEECSWAYFTVFHPQQPLIHWPTFDMHTVSLPLLLAVVFGGSVHCVPTDGALSSRSFFDLGEDFIFEHLRDIVVTPDRGHDGHALEAVQAALLIVALQSSFNNEAARRRVRVSRHPELIAAIRSLRLLEPAPAVEKSNGIPEWTAFIQEESRVRAVYFMFVMDCMDTFFFSLLPKMAIAEVSQTLPCNDVLFDASTPDEFHRLCTQSSRLSHQKPSIKQLISSLMGENWSDEQNKSLLDSLELRHLMICIFGRITLSSISLLFMILKLMMCIRSIAFNRLCISSGPLDPIGMW